MPELPEIGALVDHLRRPAVGTTIGRVDVAALSVLKTFDSPINALHGQTVTGAGRWGKYLGVQAGPLWLIAHLSRAGWLRWSDKLAAAPLPPGKGPIALRVHLGTPGVAPGFDLTEAGTQKRLAVWLVEDPRQVPGIATLGPDALELGPEELAGVLGPHTGRIKTVMTDQKVIAGITATKSCTSRRSRRSPRPQNCPKNNLPPCTTRWFPFSPTRSAVPSARAPPRSKGRSVPACGCTRAPACRARCAGTPCERFRSRTSHFNIARPARPAAKCCPTGACRGYSSSGTRASRRCAG